MFLYKAFIRKNTPELIKMLKGRKLNICPCCSFEGAVWLDNCIDNYFNYIHGIGYTDPVENLTQEQELKRYLSETKHYDCGENDLLFLDLVSYRDDSDFGQLFINVESELYCHSFEDSFSKPGWRKCLPDEIIDYHIKNQKCDE